MQTSKREFFLTAEGLAKLEEELHELIHTKRIEIAQRLKEAKEYGDLSENSQWDDAKDQQAYIEGRIAEIENIIKHSSVIKANGKSKVVDLGSTVHLELEEGVHKYVIVGSTEANPEEGRISNESPIGRALMGKKPGEEVHVEVPNGTMTYKIKHVE
jgi:transcription elongation factor GreA